MTQWMSHMIAYNQVGRGDFFANRKRAHRLMPSTICTCLLSCWMACIAAAESPWPRHTIDDSSRGADGVRLADFNQDGRMDVVTGWEEGGEVRVCLQPEPSQVKQPWQSILVTRSASPEDAFAVDLNQDGRLDVVSCHEGKQQSIHVAWNSDDSEFQPSNPLDFPAARGVARWMYACAMQVDGQHGLDLIVGSKGNSESMVGWLQCPENAEDLSAWRLHRIVQASWIMSLEPIDMDADGDLDLVVTDRKGKRRGVYWLEKSSSDGQQWKRHNIGLEDQEVMFAQILVTADTGPSIWVATRNGQFHCLEQGERGWETQSFTNPFACTSGKAIAIAQQDPNTIVLAHTSNTAVSQVRHQSPGVSMTKVTREDGRWTLGPWVDVSGTMGTKFDRAEWIDLDSDGDLDLMTCEETDDLGVFWYENPS